MKQLNKGYLNYLLPCLAILSILLTVLNVVFWNDDFNNINSIQSHGFIKEAELQYLTWDGRSISPLSMFRIIFLYYAPIQTLPLLALLSIFLSAWLILNTFKKFELLTFDFVTAVIAGILLWFGYCAHIARSVYWVTGSYYEFANLLIFLWIYLYVKQTKNKKIFLFLTFTIVSGGINIAVIIFASMLLFHVFKIRKINFKEDFLILLIYIIAFSLSTFAPGNFLRAKSNYNTEMSLNISVLFHNFFIVLKEYILMSKYIFIGALFLGLILLNTVTLNNNKINIFGLSLIFFIIGFSSITPFVFIPNAASKHTSIHFQTFTFISIFLFAIGLFTKINLKLPIWTNVLLIHSISLFIFYTGIKQFNMGSRIKKDIEKRYKYLESKRNTKDTIYLKPLNQPPAFFTTRVWDIKSPPDDCNFILERYFNTGPIFTEKDNH